MAPDRRVVVDGPARRLATSSTSPGSRCRRSSPCASRSAPASRRRRPRRARCCSPPCRPRSSTPPSPIPSRAGLPPLHRPHAASSCCEELDAGPRPRLGAGRRGARARRPLGRRPGPRRHGRRARRDERHRARRRDEHRARCSTTTCRCCCARPATSAPTGRCGSAAPTSRLRGPGADWRHGVHEPRDVRAEGQPDRAGLHELRRPVDAVNDWALDDDGGRADLPAGRRPRHHLLGHRQRLRLRHLGGDRRPRHRRVHPPRGRSSWPPRCSSRCTTARAAAACPARRSWSRSTPR